MQFSGSNKITLIKEGHDIRCWEHMCLMRLIWKWAPEEAEISVALLSFPKPHTFFLLWSV